MSDIDWQFEERLSGGASDVRDPDSPPVEAVTSDNPLHSRAIEDVEVIDPDITKLHDS